MLFRMYTTAVLFFGTTAAFSVPQKSSQQIISTRTTTSSSSSSYSSSFSRRDSLTFASSVLIGGTTFLSNPENAFAAKGASSSGLEQDKAKIVKGYKRLTYLLDNWEKETTKCNRNDNPYIGCERTPEKVMEYLGYKSMEDPLFRADKTLMRLQTAYAQDDPDFQDAVDVFMEKAEEGNGMAFISSWGEANPGGGKDRVELFIERSKKDVIESKQSLETVIRILNLSVD
eukprot:CAMPEP_0178954796 /NCGR_PEP_ID=MMETSP0789-20121207/9209_1 /TAXON_ID=3005 /ORGANISM="Rhizosolenia setigera, Strain CCMP 1694" /LENGTH=228 /DNA_ID=CAMNT_0020636277 /DNA_START=95 /DNA_END=781 /DNA_ORIENTATION=+